MILRFTVSSAPKFWRALASCVLQGLFLPLLINCLIVLYSFHIHGLSSRVRAVLLPCSQFDLFI